MTDDRRREIEEVRSRYGPIAEIPDDVLLEKRLKVIHDPSRTTYQMVTEEDYEDLTRHARSVMARYKNYIFAGDLSRMIRLFSCHELITLEEIDQIATYAQSFISAGIPPNF